jgi:RimJ/RimL family protein N-acetyltransferase
MVLPEHQGRGVGTRAVRMMLGRARDEHRWGLVHATPAVTNGPSNGLCRSVGFRLLGERDIEYSGLPFRVNDWVIDPATDLPR